jgi:autotransporter-associated beta strand protein
MDADKSVTANFQSLLANWTGGDGAIWDTSATNWSGVSGTPWDAANGANNTANFNSTSGSATVNGTVYTKRIAYSAASGGFAITNGTIQLAGTSPSIEVGSGLTLTIGSTLSGSTGLTKSGSGTLVLTGNNNYTGTTAVDAGVLSLASAYLDDASTVSISSGAVLNLTHSSIDNVVTLLFGGIAQPAGIYNAANSGGYITGSGSIRVVAVVYNVNFSGGIGGTYLGNYTGVGAAPDVGTYWNQIQQTQNAIGNYNASISNLTASNGTTSSGITVSVDYSRAYNDAGSTNNLLGSWFQGDGSVNGGAVGRVLISGLAAGTYDLYTYGINGAFASRGTRFIINNNNWTGGTPDGANYNWLQTTGASASDFQQGVNYVTFSGVQSYNGNIEFLLGANPAGDNQQAPINGLQLVRSTSMPTYASWAANNAGGQAANLDYDSDGVSNGIEFFMNAAPGFTANPGFIGNTVTWPNGGNIPSSAYGTQFSVQTSSDLASWTNVPASDSGLNNTASALSYGVSGASKQFVRLKVTAD